jgi:hypothetical protein
VATGVATKSPGAHLPTPHQLRVAGAVLDELARAHSTPWSNPATRETLATVAAWLDRVATPGRAAGRCECGAALAHVAGAGAAAVLCPVCDHESVHDAVDSDVSLDLNAQLADLGKDAARDAWVEHAGNVDTIPRRPEWPAWQRLSGVLAPALAERGRLLSEGERRAYVRAYRTELRALATGGAP